MRSDPRLTARGPERLRYAFGGRTAARLRFVFHVFEAEGVEIKPAAGQEKEADLPRVGQDIHAEGLQVVPVNVTFKQSVNASLVDSAYNVTVNVTHTAHTS